MVGFKSWHSNEAWKIIFVMILLLCGIQTMLLVTSYMHKRYVFENRVNEKLKKAVDQLNLSKIEENPDNQNMAGYNIETGELYIRIDSIEKIFPLDSVIDEDLIRRQMQYDLRNTNYWKLFRLSDIFKHMTYKRQHSFPFMLILTDTSGNILDKYSEGKVCSCNKLETEAVPLGFMDKHILKIEYNFPLSLFIRSAWGDLLVSGLLFITLLYTIFILFAYYRREKRIRMNQGGYVHHVVHDLRSPIVTMKQTCRYLQTCRDTELPQEEVERFEYLQSLCMQTLDNIRRLLNEPVTEQGLRLNLSKKDIRPMLQKIAKEYEQGEGYPKKVHVQADCPEKMPDVWADHDYLQAVVDNLMSNAVKYSGPEVEIAIKCRYEHDHLCLSVKDNGFGMSKQEQKHIFEIYYRGGGYKKDVVRKGHGIGLNIVNEIVRAHKGKIEVMSEEGKGSEFRIEIPQRKSIWKRK